MALNGSSAFLEAIYLFLKLSPLSEALPPYGKASDQRSTSASPRSSQSAVHIGPKFPLSEFFTSVWQGIGSTFNFGISLQFGKGMRGREAAEQPLVIININPASAG
jgi:hypothetical protein